MLVSRCPVRDFHGHAGRLATAGFDKNRFARCSAAVCDKTWDFAAAARGGEGERPEI